MQKEELVQLYGEVLSTSEATEKYEFVAFCAPFVEVKCRADNRRGTSNFITARDFILTLLKILKINCVRSRRELFNFPILFEPSRFSRSRHFGLPPR